MTTASPAASAAPEPESSASASGPSEQELIDEAIAALTEYLALANEIENNGGEGWEALEPWWGDEMMAESGRAHFATLVQNGWRTEGASRVDRAAGTVTADSPPTVKLEYCLDGTAVSTVDAAGAPFAETPDHAFPVEADWRWVGRWQVLDTRPSWEETC